MAMRKSIENQSLLPSNLPITAVCVSVLPGGPTSLHTAVQSFCVNFRMPQQLFCCFFLSPVVYFFLRFSSPINVSVRSFVFHRRHSLLFGCYCTRPIYHGTLVYYGLCAMVFRSSVSARLNTAQSECIIQSIVRKTNVAHRIGPLLLFVQKR